jgi:glutamine synthetase
MSLMLIADRLEKASDPEAESLAVAKRIFGAHKRIIFNGNNYSQEWVDEAEKRGLPNIASTVLAIDCLKSDKNVSVFEEQGVLSRVEVESRYEILFENYSKIINIEALTAADMAGRQILPAALSYVKSSRHLHSGPLPRPGSNPEREESACQGLPAHRQRFFDIDALRTPRTLRPP